MEPAGSQALIRPSSRPQIFLYFEKEQTMKTP